MDVVQLVELRTEAVQSRPKLLFRKRLRLNRRRNDFRLINGTNALNVYLLTTVYSKNMTFGHVDRKTSPAFQSFEIVQYVAHAV